MITYININNGLWLLIHKLTSMPVYYIYHFMWFSWMNTDKHAWCSLVNSLAPGRSQCNVIFILALVIGIFRSSHDNALWWMPQDLTDDQSTLVQVMAWWCQATSHYLSQCWPIALSAYGVTRPKWVKSQPMQHHKYGMPHSNGQRKIFWTIKKPWVQLCDTDWEYFSEHNNNITQESQYLKSLAILQLK